MLKIVKYTVVVSTARKLTYSLSAMMTEQVAGAS